MLQMAKTFTGNQISTAGMQKRIAKRTEAYVDNFKDLDDNKEIR